MSLNSLTHTTNSDFTRISHRSSVEARSSHTTDHFFGPAGAQQHLNTQKPLKTIMERCKSPTFLDRQKFASKPLEFSFWNGATYLEVELSSSNVGSGGANGGLQTGSGYEGCQCAGLIISVVKVEKASFETLKLSIGPKAQWILAVIRWRANTR